MSTQDCDENSTLVLNATGREKIADNTEHCSTGALPLSSQKQEIDLLPINATSTAIDKNMWGNCFNVSKTFQCKTFHKNTLNF